jgi:hypothetical protein
VSGKFVSGALPRRSIVTLAGGHSADIHAREVAMDVINDLARLDRLLTSAERLPGAPVERQETRTERVKAYSVRLMRPSAGTLAPDEGGPCAEVSG